MKLTIEKLVYGGEGLSRSSEGEVIFVPFSAPGDVIQAERIANSAKPAKASIQTLEKPSEERVEPPCKVFETCGGCQWQHLSIDAQRLWKRNIVLESLQRIGKLPDVQVLETLGAGEWQFRNRVQWDVTLDGDSFEDKAHYKLGYYQAQSHEVVEFDTCQIIPEPLNAIAQDLRRKLAENPELASGILRVEAFMNPAQDILLTLEGESGPSLKPLAAQLLASHPKIKGVCHLNTALKKALPVLLAGSAALLVDLAGNQYQVSSGSFFQTNYEGAQLVLDTIGELLPAEMGSLLDLYTGVGLFAIHFAGRARKVLGIESSPLSVADFQENLRLNRIQNVRHRAGDACQLFKTIKERFEVAIVDPPRAGCQVEVLDWLSSHVSKQLVYVSCNPTTLARDLKLLVANGWQVDTVRPIDMFPQTYHVETIVSLSR